MNIEDIKFLEDNIENFNTLELGYVKNIPIEKMIRYENIYKSYVDKHFILTYWCKHCVMDMLTRLKRFYDTNYKL